MDGIFVNPDGYVMVDANGYTLVTDQDVCPECGCNETGPGTPTVYVIGIPCKGGLNPDRPVVVRRSTLETYYTTKYGSPNPSNVGCAVFTAVTNVGTGCYRFGATFPGRDDAAGAYEAIGAGRENCCSCLLSDCDNNVLPPAFPANKAYGVSLSGQRPCCLPLVTQGEALRSAGTFTRALRQQGGGGGFEFEFNVDAFVAWDVTMTTEPSVVVLGSARTYGFNGPLTEFPGPFDSTQPFAFTIDNSMVLNAGDGTRQRFTIVEQVKNLLGLTGSMQISCNTASIAVSRVVPSGMETYTGSETLTPADNKGCGQRCGGAGSGGAGGAPVISDEDLELSLFEALSDGRV